jgi:molybdopterin-guanine dinucleotide biosynthesis protein B
LKPPVLGFAGYSGSGKTTLLELVIALLVGQGLRISLIKHAHHQFDIDIPGKDSWRHRKAGAHEVLVASSERWALMHEHRGEEEPPLDVLLSKLAPCDLVLVEGFKFSAIPKVEVWRSDAEKPRLDEMVSGLIAHICDESAKALMRHNNAAVGEGTATDINGVASELPILDINNAAAVTAFIVDYFKLQPVTRSAQSNTITVRYFAGLRESVQRDRETFALQHETTLADVLATLRQRGAPWDAALSTKAPIKCALNQEMASPSSAVRAGDEVALFPPVTGG